MEWQPIETAPADEWVLVYYAGGEMDTVSMGKFDKSFSGHWWDLDGNKYGTPWRWMPLPPPPGE